MYEEKIVSITRRRQIQIERQVIEKLNMTGDTSMQIPQINDYVAITLRGQAFHIGETVKALMKKRNLDVVALAWHSQVSESTIYNVRRATHLAELETLLKLSQALDATVILTFDVFGSTYESKLERQTLVLPTLANCRWKLMNFMRTLDYPAQSRQLIGLRASLGAATIGKLEEHANHRATWESIVRLSAGLLYRPGVRLSDNEEYRHSRSCKPILAVA